MKKLKMKPTIAWLRAHKGGDQQMVCNDCHPQRPYGKNWFRVTKFKKGMKRRCDMCFRAYAFGRHWRAPKGVDYMAAAIEQRDSL